LGGAGYFMINSIDQSHQLQWACKQLEAHFLQTLLKEARRTMPGDPFASSSASRTFREMLDEQLANTMAQAGGVGIAQMLLAQLEEKK
jgi:flagellar protein FlgJ